MQGFLGTVRVGRWLKLDTISSGSFKHVEIDSRGSAYTLQAGESVIDVKVIGAWTVLVIHCIEAKKDVIKSSVQDGERTVQNGWEEEEVEE